MSMRDFLSPSLLMNEFYVRSNYVTKFVSINKIYRLVMKFDW